VEQLQLATVVLALAINQQSLGSLELHPHWEHAEAMGPAVE
jgi:hypothetical protein